MRGDSLYSRGAEGRMVLTTEMLYNVNITLRKVTAERTPRQMRARSLLDALDESEDFVMIMVCASLRGYL